MSYYNIEIRRQQKNKQENKQKNDIRKIVCHFFEKLMVLRLPSLGKQADFTKRHPERGRCHVGDIG